MKNLQFTEIALVSQIEEAGMRLQLDPVSTAIKGENSTGKSSLIKSLYSCFGAKPYFIHERWQSARLTISVKFSIDGKHYRVVKSPGRYSFFDSSDSLIATYTNVTYGLSKHLAELFDFHLSLTSQSKDGEAQATPAFLFLPFYLDQDGGWAETLNSFQRLQQFRSPKRDVMQFHFGIRPSEYYKAKAEAKEADSQAQPLRQERKVLEGVEARIDKSMSSGDFSLDIQNFQEEVDTLLDRCRNLQQEQESLRVRMSHAYTKLKAINDQIDITKQALGDLREDREYASGLSGEVVECPMCHAEYENNFAERFSIAVDEDQCVSLLSNLYAERELAEKEYARSREETARAQVLVDEINELLAARREQVRLKDVVRSEGRREVKAAVHDEMSVIDQKIGELDAIKTSATDRMKSFDNKKHTAEIKGYYQSEMARLLEQLDVRNLNVKAYKRLDAKIQESGSVRPRAILAYFLACLRTIHRYSTSTMCPVVIDSPRQQDQDDVRWDLMMTAIANERPDGSQLIIGSTQDNDMDFGGKVVTFSNVDQLLSHNHFDDVRGELTPLIQQALESEGGGKAEA